MIRATQLRSHETHGMIWSHHSELQSDTWDDAELPEGAAVVHLK